MKTEEKKKNVEFEAVDSITIQGLDYIGIGGGSPAKMGLLYAVTGSLGGCIIIDGRLYSNDGMHSLESIYIAEYSFHLVNAFNQMPEGWEFLGYGDGEPFDEDYDYLFLGFISNRFQESTYKKCFKRNLYVRRKKGEAAKDPILDLNGYFVVTACSKLSNDVWHDRLNSTKVFKGYNAAKSECDSMRRQNLYNVSLHKVQGIAISEEMRELNIGEYLEPKDFLHY